jgi:hypothetical protein
MCCVSQVVVQPGSKVDEQVSLLCASFAAAAEEEEEERSIAVL